MPRALTMAPRKMAPDLKIRWHNWNTFVVPNLAVPNFACSNPPPPKMTKCTHSTLIYA